MKSILTAGLAFLLLGSPMAFAQNREHDGLQSAQNNEIRGNPHWDRGDRLPTEYRGDRYMVGDWRAEHLRKPPRGYHWARVGDRYLLVEQRNGLIRDWKEAGLRH